VEPPLILVSNDDGVDAPGISVLARAMEPLGEVWIVAPKDEQSAVSNAISLRHPLRVRRRGDRRIAVSGTPTDCVYIGMNHALPRRPAICVSGINHGANLGDDLFYSGTVAAAIEATVCDVPSIAFSFAGRNRELPDYVDEVIQDIARTVLDEGLPRGTFLNVNLPPATDRPLARLTRLGRRNYGRVVIEKKDPRQQAYFWLGGSELGFDDIPGSDCNAVADGFVSVTPVDLDLTHYALIKRLRRWDLFTDPGTTEAT
jgi:5'-nucleotidase